MEAVRRERLQRVHRDLLTAAAGDRVTDAAMRWGFFHLGRFSSAYAARFGELPSETRRRSQSGQAQPPRVAPVGRITTGVSLVTTRLAGIVCRRTRVRPDSR